LCYTVGAHCLFSFLKDTDKKQVVSANEDDDNDDDDNDNKYE